MSQLTGLNADVMFDSTKWDSVFINGAGIKLNKKQKINIIEDSSSKTKSVVGPIIATRPSLYYDFL